MASEGEYDLGPGWGTWFDSYSHTSGKSVRITVCPSRGFITVRHVVRGWVATTSFRADELRVRAVLMSDAGEVMAHYLRLAEEKCGG